MSDENENSRSAELSAPANFDPAFGPMLAPVEPTEAAQLEMDPVFGPMLGGLQATPPAPAPVLDPDGIPFAGAPLEWFNAGTPRTRTQVFEPGPELYRDPIVDFRTPARRRLASLVGK